MLKIRQISALADNYIYIIIKIYYKMIRECLEGINEPTNINNFYYQESPNNLPPLLICNDRFFKQNKEIQFKIIEIIYKFLMPKRELLRSIKICNLLDNKLYNSFIKALWSK